MATKRQRVVNLLRGAAEAIRKYGWVQRTFGNKTCGFCLVGAINSVDRGRGSSTYFAAHMALVKAVKQSRVMIWNDAKGRTKRQVLGALKLAERFV